MGTQRTRTCERLWIVICCLKSCKTFSHGYSQNRFDKTKKSTTQAFKTTSQRASQKTAEATVDFAGNEIADKIIIRPEIIESKGKYIPKYFEYK